jgi:ferric-dicitrate binding protein FerR (iron transport regulator)
MQKTDGATAGKRLRFYAKARTALQRLNDAAATADSRGRLSVPLGPLQSAVALVLSVVPG